MSLAAMPANAREELNNETFAGKSTEPGVWDAPAVEGRLPTCLTAATENVEGSLPGCEPILKGDEEPDPEGKGVARLTDDRKNDRGALLMHDAINARDGLELKFDFFQYKAKIHNGTGGDGISFFLVDGSEEKLEVGESGGRLGYKGIPGAYVGVGFDEYGNFSTKSDKEFSTGPGKAPNHIVLRGSEASDYAYQDGVESPAPLAVDDATDREDARRSVDIKVTTEGHLSLAVDYHDGKGSRQIFEGVNLNDTEPLPETVKLGFASSTGDATAYHEIQGFQAASLDPDLSVAVTGTERLEAGQDGEATLQVENAEAASATRGDVAVTYELPEGLKPSEASGDGWKCEINGQKVTCTRPGENEDALQSGDAAPPITVKYTAGPEASGELVGKATVETPTDGEAKNNTAENQVVVSPGENPTPAAGPDLVTTTAGDTQIPPGGTGEAIVNVANKGDGPTDGVVTATYTAGPGIEVTGASGDGWTCTVEGQKVSCTRPGTGDDALPGGEAYPPVNVGLKVPDGTPAGDASGTSSVSTPNDTEPGNNESPGPLDVTAAGPEPTPEPEPVPAYGQGDLDVKVVSDPKPYKPGEPYKYTVTVNNNGTTDAKGAQLNADFPELWETIKWKCEASEGAKCPSPQGLGDIDTKVDVPAGGKLVFTIECRVPKKSVATYDASATLTLDGTNCPSDAPCKSEDTNGIAQIHQDDARLALPGFFMGLR